MPSKGTGTQAGALPVLLRSREQGRRGAEGGQGPRTAAGSWPSPGAAGHSARTHSLTAFDADAGLQPRHGDDQHDAEDEPLLPQPLQQRHGAARRGSAPPGAARRGSAGLAAVPLGCCGRGAGRGPTARRQGQPDPLTGKVSPTAAIATTHLLIAAPLSLPPSRPAKCCCGPRRLRLSRPVSPRRGHAAGGGGGNGAGPWPPPPGGSGRARARSRCGGRSRQGGRGGARCFGALQRPVTARV